MQGRVIRLKGGPAFEKTDFTVVDSLVFTGYEFGSEPSYRNQRSKISPTVATRIRHAKGI